MLNFDGFAISANIATNATKGSIKRISGEYGDCVGCLDQNERDGDKVFEEHFV